MQQSPKYTNTQKLNGRYQELDPTHFTVLLVPTWWIFTLPSDFLPHLENFTLNPKSFRNTTVIANTNILIGRRILPPPPPHLYPKECLNPILPPGRAKYAPLLFFLHHPKTAQGIKLKLSDFKNTPLRHILQVKPVR